MAKALDLEEQEQLDKLKAFWARFGNLITWTITGALLVVAGLNFYTYWQRQQAAGAAAIYDELERAAGAGEVDRVKQMLADVKDKYPRALAAQQAALIAAQSLSAKGEAEPAQAALRWVVDSSRDPGLKAVARLRLSAALAEQKKLDEALGLLNADAPAAFAPLMADRRGDLLVLQGKPDEARAAFKTAFAGLGADNEYRRLVEVKLISLGVDPKTLEPAKDNKTAEASK
jgi:predicted negative regulator of RcsB-dependent stress response